MRQVSYKGQTREVAKYSEVWDACVRHMLLSIIGAQRKQQKTQNYPELVLKGPLLSNRPMTMKSSMPPLHTYVLKSETAPMLDNVDQWIISKNCNFQNLEDQRHERYVQKFNASICCSHKSL